MATKKKEDKEKGWDEFDCPECSAHNPWGDRFNVGDQVFCSWCGAVLIVKRFPDDPTRYKLVVDR
jgi:hypothetical protein